MAFSLTQYAKRLIAAQQDAEAPVAMEHRGKKYDLRRLTPGQMQLLHTQGATAIIEQIADLVKQKEEPAQPAQKSKKKKGE